MKRNIVESPTVNFGQNIRLDSLVFFCGHCSMDVHNSLFHTENGLYWLFEEVHEPLGVRFGRIGRPHLSRSVRIYDRNGAGLAEPSLAGQKLL